MVLRVLYNADEPLTGRGIERLCGTKPELMEIKAKAIGEGWGMDKVELEVLRAERPKGPAIVSSVATLRCHLPRPKVLYPCMLRVSEMNPCEGRIRPS